MPDKAQGGGCGGAEIDYGGASAGTCYPSHCHTEIYLYGVIDAGCGTQPYDGAPRSKQPAGTMRDKTSSLRAAACDRNHCC